MGWQTFGFTRNLHCWQFSFNWMPGRSYFLHIYVKKPELRDIKLESRSKNNRNNSIDYEHQQIKQQLEMSIVNRMIN